LHSNALDQSQFNFDLRIMLLDIYKQLQLDSCFAKEIKRLGLKGVQLETLGILNFNDLIQNSQIDQFNSEKIKYDKFFKRMKMT
jgi:hypothetical protein